jgi:hypothetical protein
MAGLFEKLLRRLGKRPAEEIVSEFQEYVNSAKDYIVKYQQNVEAITKQRTMLELMAHHLGGLVWIKRWDEEQKIYLYEFANRTHCDLFFKFEPECLADCTAHVAGKSDIDILNEFRERTKQRHTYGDLCFSTDMHSTEQAIIHYETGGKKGATSCRYIEGGFIGEKPFVLEVVKTPLFDPKYPCRCWQTHTYTVGNAFDITNVCESRMKHAQRCVELGQGEKLQNGVFWLYPQKEECSLLECEIDK